SLAITMRTPGNDEELVTGFLYSEGIISTLQDIEKTESFGPTTENYQLKNRFRVYLKSSQQLDIKRFQRHFFTNSSCGICGKSSLKALEMLRKPQLDQQKNIYPAELLTRLAETLRKHQQQFSLTGGLHAVALFDPEGNLLAMAEDIGRHNAMDKLIGALLLEEKLPCTQGIVMVSGRASFELVQKALMSNLPGFIAVGAPSSLAVDLARQNNMTLLGFMKRNSFNCYSGEWRIVNS
ncbi:MAG: formate dehydrogenase accessory sulfurtransferase FdhD, partial [Pseudomonadales bacterium]|nr:formate dehydrogenase accessory sulfurtransferase FdhD [Pseudomonadales bacterium]